MFQPNAFTAKNNQSNANINDAAPVNATDAAFSLSGNVVTLILADIEPGSKLWGYSRFVIGRFSVRKVPGLKFHKVLGSGYDGGFGLKPSTTRQGLLCAFANENDADNFLYKSPVAIAYQAHSREYLSVKLHPFSVKGTWAGNKLVATRDGPLLGHPIAALTRASIRPSKASTFWSKAPPSEVSLANTHGCLLASGVGEAPYLRQATFSVWESVAHMDAYARTGAHLEAIKASMKGDYFSESMFVRFVPQELRGTYKGKTYDL